MAFALVCLAVFVAVMIGMLLWKPSTRNLSGDEMPPQFCETEDCKIAVHEAGHAVTAWCCTIVANVFEAGIRHADGGAVLFKSLTYNSSDVKWCEIVICVSGVAAEVAVYGRVRTGGAARDLIRARVAAQDLIGRGDSEAPWRRKEKNGSLPFLKIYDPPPTEEEELILRNAYAEAKTIVRSHGECFYRLVSALMAKGTLSGKEIEAILGRRGFSRLVGMVKPTFLRPGSGRPVKPKRERKAA